MKIDNSFQLFIICCVCISVQPKNTIFVPYYSLLCTVFNNLKSKHNSEKIILDSP